MIYSLGPSLRATRKQAKCTQRQLGNLIGCSRQEIGRFEMGTKVMPLEMVMVAGRRLRDDGDLLELAMLDALARTTREFSKLSNRRRFLCEL